MTQEEKAKAYDEALERANDILKGCDPPKEDSKATINYIFPQLKEKESEDERIRKCMKYAIDKLFLKEKIVCDIHKDDVIAWLEKQESVGEIVERYKNSWYNEGKIQGQIEGLSDEEKYQQGWHDALEKQGEPFDDNIITRDDEILQAISVGLTDAVEDFGWSDFGGLPIEEIQDWLEKQESVGEIVKNCITDNSYETVKFPFKAKACGKIVTIHDGQLNGDGTKWIKYQSDDKDGFKIYLPEDLEPVEDDSDKIEEGDPQPMSYGKELDDKMYKACELYNNGEYSQADLFFAGVRAEYERAKKNVIEWKPADNTYYDDICELLFNILRSERYDTINKDAIRNDLDWLISIKESLQGKQK